MSNFGATMIVSVQSIGTTATLASAGFYLHRRGFVLGSLSKKTMAFLSQQVAIPALLLTNLISCVEDPINPDQCFTVTDNFDQGLWVFLVWPLYVISWGATIGCLLATLTRTPKAQKRRRAVIAATAFGNSTGLPLTLLLAIQASSPPDSPVVQTDPTVLISCYMIMQPIIQWGIGGFIFPKEDQEQDADAARKRSRSIDVEEQGRSNNLGVDVEVPSSPKIEDEANLAERSLEPCIIPMRTRIHAEELARKFLQVVSNFLQPPVIGALIGLFISAIPALRGLFVNLNTSDSTPVPLEWLYNGLHTVGQAAIPMNMVILGINLSIALGDTNPFRCLYFMRRIGPQASKRASCAEGTTSLPAEIKTHNDDKKPADEAPGMTIWTILAVIMGKLVFMPAVGVASVIGLKQFMVVPPEIAGSLQLVLMLVFITPTANNLMILVELSAGAQVKQDMAKLIACQYLVAPVLLSLSVAVVVLVATT
ncbi:Membrane transport protein [Seminavis robusta]|uniref:Membrane transport protein n=1 Tax=Seminavis robusta TaxID=568900 RepID=A0A9N8DI34_9STRA|nr:Membrane transport protein [Seminavis robusta]|eukprot:Sro76_g041460.1 Membrane transport protein (480) ;mRNA; f:1359-2875